MADIESSLDECNSLSASALQGFGTAADSRQLL